MKNEWKNEEEYTLKSPVELLNEYEEKYDCREVLFTFGNEEIIKENGKYYLANTKYPSVNKEISMQTATEMWQSFNMKTRSDVFLDFGFEQDKYIF